MVNFKRNLAPNLFTLSMFITPSDAINYPVSRHAWNLIYCPEINEIKATFSSGLLTSRVDSIDSAMFRDTPRRIATRRDSAHGGPRATKKFENRSCYHTVPLTLLLSNISACGTAIRSSILARRGEQPSVGAARILHVME